MEEKKLTLDDLLNSLQNPEEAIELPNTKDTWSRIGKDDKFEELGLNKSELEEFLQEWTSNNPYDNI